MSNRRILRWDVWVNDEEQKIGGGKVVHVDCRLPERMLTAYPPTELVEVWTEEVLDSLTDISQLITRTVRVVGTAHEIPDGYEHIGSVVDPNPSVRLVWHIYEKRS